MTLTAAGRLLLGTTTESTYLLDVNGTARVSGVLTVLNSSSEPVNVKSSASVSAFILDNTNANLWGGNYVVRVNGSDKNYFGTLGSLLGTTNYDATIWATSGNGFRVYTNGNNRRFEISSTGAAEFTSSVTAIKSLIGDNGFGSQWATFAHADATGTSNAFVGIDNSNGSQISNIKTNGSFEWRVSNSNVMSLKTTGNLLVGTTTDNGSKFQVTGAATFSSSVTAASFSIPSLSSGNGAYNFVYSGNTSSRSWRIVNDVVSFGDFAIQQSTTHTGSTYESKLYFNATGNVGIGTTSPAAKLHLVDSVESEIRTQYSTTSSGKLITGNGFTTIGSITNDPLVFVSNNTERMRFTNGGNLLLGSTSDTGEKFQLTGAGIVSGLFTVSGSTGIPATTATYIRFASGFASPDIGRMYIGDGSGWKFHMSKRLSSTTTDLITFFDNGSVQTSAPTGYAAKPYKLGEVLDGAVTIPTKSVAVEIDGTVYFLLASTTLP